MCQWNITDFVEKQRSAIGELKPPDTIAQGTGECAPGVTEELTFKKLRWDRSAVDAHERPASSRTPFMDGGSDQFLAGSRLSKNQRGCIRLRHHFDLLQNTAQCSALTNDFAERECVPDLVPQIVSFQLKFAAQSRDFIKRSRVGNRDG